MSKAIGPKGHYLAFCRTIRRVPLPISVPVFGNVSTVAEVLNIHDNFAAGELRDGHVEQALRTARNPLVIDCGVNVGVTVRWWLHLNPTCRVVGIDMMKESHEFTRQRLGGRVADYTGITAALAAVDGEEVTLRFDDALEGTNRIGQATRGALARTLLTRRIDTVLSEFPAQDIHLLKMDIEGFGAKALAGATRTLSATQNVILEVHNEEEIGESEAILVGSGFRLRHFNRRNVWFTRHGHARVGA